MEKDKNPFQSMLVLTERRACVICHVCHKQLCVCYLCMHVLCLRNCSLAMRSALSIISPFLKNGGSMMWVSSFLLFQNNKIK